MFRQRTLLLPSHATLIRLQALIYFMRGAEMKRDNFSQKTKDVLAKRVGGICSNPDCRSFTVGPNSSPHSSVSIGVAAHITAASPGGPRYDSTLSSDERSSIDNGIWLCQNCAKLIDSDPERFSTAVIQKWKLVAEKHAANQLKTPFDTGHIKLHAIPIAPSPYVPHSYKLLRTPKLIGRVAELGHLSDWAKRNTRHQELREASVFVMEAIGGVGQSVVASLAFLQ